MDRFEIMINNRHGGFDLSDEALDLYKKITGKEYIKEYMEDREDSDMISIVKTLKNKASDGSSRIITGSVPLKYKKFYSIEEYDGLERVEIKYDKWAISSILQLTSECSTVDSKKIIEIIEESEADKLLGVWKRT